MRMHKMGQDEIDEAMSFAKASELMLSRGKFSMTEAFEEWKDFDDDDEEKVLILKIRDRIAKEEGIIPEDVDGRILAYEYLQDKYSYRITVAVWTSDIVINQVCDPMLSYLELHPSYYQNHVTPEQ